MCDTMISSASYMVCSVLFPHPCYEDFGLTTLEAMASGTPVITSNTSALAEVLSQEGIMADPYDVQALGGAIRHGLGEGEFVAEMRRRAFRGQKFFLGKRQPGRRQNYTRKYMNMKRE